MKAYLISTITLILLLMLNMYLTVKNFPENNTGTKKEMQQNQDQGQTHSVIAFEKDAIAGGAQFIGSNAGIISRENSALHKRNITQKFDNLFFKPFGNTELACDQISFVENKYIFWDAKPGGL
jgi:hypothetical protein